MYLHDLFRVHLSKRAAHHRKVLGKHPDFFISDVPETCDDRVFGDGFILKVKIDAPVLDERVYLKETALVQQLMDPFSSRHFFRLMLFFDGFRPTAFIHGVALFYESLIQ